MHVSSRYLCVRMQNLLESSCHFPSRCSDLIAYVYYLLLFIIIINDFIIIIV